MVCCRMAGGTCMLIAGELAVRRVSKIEATLSAQAAKFNFSLTSRTQVSSSVISLRWRIYGHYNPL